jgi:hypothetical protein
LYSDAVKTTGNEDMIKVRDIIQLVEESLGPEHDRPAGRSAHRDDSLNLSTLTDDLIPTIAGGLASRLRSLMMVLDRLDRLESGERDVANSRLTNYQRPPRTDPTGITRRRRSDQLAILRRWPPRISCSLVQLISATGLGRLSSVGTIE